MTCTQESEFKVDCTRPSVLYENVCHECNPEAKMKAPLEKVRQDVPSIYVGESSRSIFERGIEHWKDWEGRKGTSHILKHQEEAHSSNEDPKFTMRVVRSYRSALARQVGEAVRIRRRGGEGRILNSKAEYSRCVIPRLTLERIDEEELDKLERDELEAKKEQMEAELSEWESIRYYARESKLKEMKKKIKLIDKKIEARKREEPGFVKKEDGRKRRRKLQHPVELERWGEEASSHNLDERGPPALAGDGLVGTSSKNGCFTPVGVLQRVVNCPTTTTLEVVVGEEQGAAPSYDRERGRRPGRPSHQPLITDIFSKQRLLKLAGCDEQGGSNSETHADTFAAAVLSPGDADVVGDTCGNDEENTPAPLNEGMNIITSIDVSVVKDDRMMTMPSSGGEENEEVCMFKRGVCMKHGIKGEKFVQSTKNWRDRGGGRGYAFVTSKRVKYRCRAKSEVPRSSSPLLSEVGGAETSGDDQL